MFKDLFNKTDFRQILIASLFLPICILIAFANGEYELIFWIFSLLLILGNLLLLILLIKNSILYDVRHKFGNILKFVLYNIVILVISFFWIRNRIIPTEMYGIHEALTIFMIGLIQIAFVIIFSISIFVIPLFVKRKNKKK